MGESEEDDLRRLVDSSLWKENVYLLGHNSVWGSWYDLQARRWGYACCRSFDRHGSCQSIEPSGAAPSGPLSSDNENSDVSDTDEEKEARRRAEERPIDWSGAPAELLPRASLEDAASNNGGQPGSAFLAHFLYFAVGAWRQLLEKGAGGQGGPDGGPEGASPSLFEDAQALQEAEAALAPLVRQLEKNALDPTVLQQLDRMVSLAAEREYADAGKAYMDMVLGNKKWNNTLASYGGTGGTNKGARIYITKQDVPNEYDLNPVAQKYIQCIRKLVYVTQCVRPNSDSSKHVHI